LAAHYGFLDVTGDGVEDLLVHWNYDNRSNGFQAALEPV
jgi:hypothetical protein